MRVKLSDITNYSKGIQINGDDLIVDGEFAYLNGGINPSGRWNASNVNGNTVTISEGGNSSGYINYMTEPFWCGAHCYYLYDGPTNSKYLYYALKSQQYRMFNIRSGACMPNIKKSDLGNFEFEFDYDEGVQNRVVSILSTVETIITQRKKELESFDELIKARFVEMFGDGHDGVCKTENLGKFCKFQQGTQVPIEEQIEERREGYTRFLRIIDYTQAPQAPRYVSVKGREITEDSVVIVRYGATAGFVGHGYAGILANNLFEVVPDESVLSKDFLYLALKYGAFEKEVHDKAFGAAMPALSFGMMNDICVVTPNSTMQNGFVDFVKQVDKSKVAVKNALAETQKLFDSLLQEYFGGLG